VTEHSITTLQKALHNHHRGHARATLGTRPRQVRKRTPKTTSALEYSAQTHRIHMWEHVEVINRAETWHSPHQDHEKDGGIRYGSGVRLGIRRLVSTCALARACPRWSGRELSTGAPSEKPIKKSVTGVVCSDLLAFLRPRPVVALR
jgi:hypothetical protein